MKKLSAGLLVYRINNGQLEVLVAHPGGPFYTKKDLGVWSIPKGEHKPEDDPKAAARREFKEELGHDAPSGTWLDLGSVEQKNNKIVNVWAVEGDLDATQTKSNTFEMEWPPRSGQKQEFPEIDRAEWFPVAIAAQKLNPAQAEFLDRLAEKTGFAAPPPPAEQSSLF